MCWQFLSNLRFSPFSDPLRRAAIEEYQNPNSELFKLSSGEEVDRNRVIKKIFENAHWSWNGWFHAYFEGKANRVIDEMIAYKRYRDFGDRGKIALEQEVDAYLAPQVVERTLNSELQGPEEPLSPTTLERIASAWKRAMRTSQTAVKEAEARLEHTGKQFEKTWGLTDEQLAPVFEELAGEKATFLEAVEHLINTTRNHPAEILKRIIRLTPESTDEALAPHTSLIRKMDADPSLQLTEGERERVRACVTSQKVIFKTKEDLTLPTERVQTRLTELLTRASTPADFSREDRRLLADLAERVDVIEHLLRGNTLTEIERAFLTACSTSQLVIFQFKRRALAVLPQGYLPVEKAFLTRAWARSSTSFTNGLPLLDQLKLDIPRQKDHAGSTRTEKMTFIRHTANNREDRVVLERGNLEQLGDHLVSLSSYRSGGEMVLEPEPFSFDRELNQLLQYLLCQACWVQSGTVLGKLSSNRFYYAQSTAREAEVHDDSPGKIRILYGSKENFLCVDGDAGQHVLGEMSYRYGYLLEKVEARWNITMLPLIVESLSLDPTQNECFVAPAWNPIPS